MTEHAKRLRWIRESLKRPDGRPVDRPALSLALGWPENRWKNLESGLVWGEDSMRWVREALVALVAKTTLPEDAGQKAVDYVMGETSKKPWASAPEWREGACPEGRRVGRPPRGELSSGAARRSSGAGLPDQVRQAYADTIWRLLESGDIDPATARRELDDLNGPAYSYNLLSEQAPDAA